MKELWEIESYKEPYNNHLKTYQVVCDGLIVAKCGVGEYAERTAKMIVEDHNRTWKPIETAPRDGTEILLLIPIEWNDNKPLICSYHFDNGRWWNNLNQWLSEDRPSHWMVLPNTKEN